MPGTTRCLICHVASPARLPPPIGERLGVGRVEGESGFRLRPSLSARHFDSDHRAHPQAAPDRLLSLSLELMLAHPSLSPVTEIFQDWHDALAFLCQRIIDAGRHLA